MERDEIIATIRSLPDEIERLLNGLSDTQLRRRENGDAWSVIEVCCHLRDAGEQSVLRISRLAHEDSPVLEPYDEQQLAIERNYRQDDIARVLPAIRAVWTALAETLERLPPEAWLRAGSHPERGALTLASEAERYANHTRIHIDQVRSLLIGPR